jgi:hypothetical protein
MLNTCYTARKKLKCEIKASNRKRKDKCKWKGECTRGSRFIYRSLDSQIILCPHWGVQKEASLFQPFIHSSDHQYQAWVLLLSNGESKLSHKTLHTKSEALDRFITWSNNPTTLWSRFLLSFHWAQLNTSALEALLQFLALTMCLCYAYYGFCALWWLGC